MSFDEASLAFYDPNALEFFDDADDEIRYQLIGVSRVRLLFVGYTLRGEKVRIITVRKANAKQTRYYNEHNS